jgi:hypothetical protein
VPFHVYHAAIPIQSGQDLVSVTLANGTTPPAGGSYPFAQLYVMGLTLETAEGAFTVADLSASEPEPEDTTAPTTTAEAEPQADGSAKVTLSAADEEGGSGVARTEYRLDGGDWTAYAEPFTVTAPGDHTVEYRSVDEAGNQEEVKSLSFTVEEPEPDTTPPATTATLDPPAPDGPGGKTYRGPVTVTLTASDGDGGSGVARTEYALDDGAWTEYGAPVRVSRHGEHVMRFRSVDEQGNLEAARQVRFVIAGPPHGPGEPYFVYGPNLALDGAVTVSSELGGYPASALNDGVQQTRSGYWNDATNGQYPDWAQIAWAQPQAVSYVVVRMPVADHLTEAQRTTGALRLQHWDGTAGEWRDVPAAGNPVSDWVAPTTADGSEARAFAFDAVTTDRIRVVVEEGNVDGWSYVEEIEAYRRRAATTPYSVRPVVGSTGADTVLQPGDRRRLVAAVTDAEGLPIPDYPVTFESRGRVLDEVRTDSAGRAAALVETGPRAGSNTFAATGPGAKPPAARFHVRTLTRGAALRVGREWLETSAAELQEGSRITASDGTVMYTPDGVGSYAGFWVRDFQYMLEGFAEGIPAEHVRDGFRYLIARQRDDGAMPDRVYADGAPFYCPGPGCDSAFGPLPATDNPQFMVKIAYGYWKSTGDLSLFERYGDQLVKGMESLPRSPSTSLVHIPPEDPSSPYGFTDTIAKTGDLLFSSLLYYEAAGQLAELSAAAGDDAGAARWTEEARTVEQDLQTLYDEESGMLLAASVDCRQIDIWGSAYAAHIGAIPEEQQRRVAEYLTANYDGLVRRGQVRHTAPGEYWEKTIVPYYKDTYQNGAYWATPSGWVASAIGDVDRGLAQQMLVDLVKDFQANGINEAVNPDVGYVAIPKYVASATNPLPAFAALARGGGRS